MPQMALIAMLVSFALLFSSFVWAYEFEIRHYLKREPWQPMRPVRVLTVCVSGIMLVCSVIWFLHAVKVAT